MGHSRTAAVLMIAAASLAAAPASQPTATDYPAMRKRMAELTVLVDQLHADVKRLTDENARLSGQVATLTPKPAENSNDRAAKLHAAALNGRVLYHGAPPADIKKAIGEPDTIARINEGWTWIYAAGSYRLNMTVYGDQVIEFSESGDIPAGK